MPNGKYEPQCGNCTLRQKEASRHHACSRHQFVMPSFDDYVVCRDWQSVWNKEGNKPFGGKLKEGYLYRWREYLLHPPEAIGRFEDVRDFLLDRSWFLYENPNNGWSLQLAPWDYELFPSPGESVRIMLDEELVAFSIREAPVITTYTRRLESGDLHVENETEIKRIVVPMPGCEKALLQWIIRHHDMDAARKKKITNLRDERNLYKDQILRLSIKIVGRPEKEEYKMLAFMGAL